MILELVVYFVSLTFSSEYGSLDARQIFVIEWLYMMLYIKVTSLIELQI